MTKGPVRTSERLCRAACPGGRAWTQTARPDGSTVIGRVEARTGLRAGAKIPIWLDDRNSVAGAPVSGSDATAAATLVALVGWLTAVGLLVFVQVGVHRLLDRRRFRAWEAEWALVEPGWNTYRR